jgi:hypothetical protein
MNKTLLATVVASLAALSVAPALAGVPQSESSRWDVRGWCTVTGGILIEGEHETTCTLADVPGRSGYDPIETGGVLRLPADIGSADEAPELKIVPSSHYPMPYHGRTTPRE